MDDDTTPVSLSADNSPLEITKFDDDAVERSDGCCARCCEPSGNCHRFAVIGFLCFLSFGSYFCYDTPGALQEQVKLDIKINTFGFMELYAWYSWPTVILSFFGGFLIDRVFGIRLGAIIFATFITAGQIIFAVGALADHFWIMITGRFIFGIGGGSLAVAQNTYTVAWFYGKKLNMVFGIQLSFARIGSTVNFHVMEPLYAWLAKRYDNYTLLGMTLLIAALTCIVSFACAVCLAIMYKRAETFSSRPRESHRTEKPMKIKDVVYFPLTFWLLPIVCVTYYVTIIPFIGLGNEFFIRKFDFSLSEANTVTSLIYILSAFTSPLLGFCVDRTGRNVTWIFFAVFITLVSHILLAFTFLNPFIAMTMMGISYSMLASALWPMIAFVIPQHQLGTAYGIMQSTLNFGLGVFSLVAGSTVDNKGYLTLEIINIICLCVSLISVGVLRAVDLNRGGKLNLKPTERAGYTRKTVKISD